MPPTPADPRASTATSWLAALSGVVAAAATLAVAELVATFIGAGSSPLFAVGAWVIDIVPPGVKDVVIQLFGTGDKAVLLLTLAALVTVLAAAAGLLESRRPPFGVVLLVAVAALAGVAVATRPDAPGLAALPTVAGAVVGVLVLRMAAVRLRRWRGPAHAAASVAGAATTAGEGTGPDRRSFLLFTALTAVAAIVVGAGARVVNAGSTAIAALRDAIRLPAPAAPASAIPAGAELPIDGLTPYVTPNADFYRIDTALQVPSIDPSTWTLRITGMVDAEVEIGWDELIALPLTEHLVTLACVSNEVGGDLIGNASWLGYPIRTLLGRAGVQDGADMVLSRSVDGWTAGTPLDVLLDPGTDAILAVGMNGVPLPLEHGFPVRMVVPGLYGYVSATKWVVELKVSRFADESAYWTGRGWSERGPIKTQSRIDTPRNGSSVRAGTVPIAGVAWAQHTGIAGVEVRIDDGAWQTARLADSVSADTWRQWVYEWDAPGGEHTIQVRATDASGYTQTPDEASPVPDGATGRHTVRVGVG